MSLTFLITESENRRKFGGYTTLNWRLSSREYIDNKTFLFSFDKKKNIQKKYAIL